MKGFVLTSLSRRRPRLRNVQTWNPNLHRDRNWRRALNLYSKSQLVFPPPPIYSPSPFFKLTVLRFLIWIGSDQEKTFGPTVTRLIHEYIEPERMILWDSKKRGGRPDTVQLLKDTWESFGAEVIFITSNMKGNDEMMQGCRAGEF